MRRASATCSGTSPSSSHSSAWARHLSLATGVWEARYSNSRRCRGESMSGAIGSPSGEATVSDGHCNCAKTYGDLLTHIPHPQNKVAELVDTAWVAAQKTHLRRCIQTHGCVKPWKTRQILQGGAECEYLGDRCLETYPIPELCFSPERRGT